MLKQCFNKAIAGVAMVALSPIFLALAIAIKIEDGGPVFFSQERVGFGGSSFKCHKFRTMFVDAEELLMTWKSEGHENWKKYVESNFKLKDDPRVTRIGKILRRTSLDEIPQLFNVLVGDMSLVGPRPLLAREIPDYGEACYEKYKLMIPGMTGLWQVSGRSDTSFAERASLDVKYFECRSFIFDIQLILRTVYMLFKKKGAY